MFSSDMSKTEYEQSRSEAIYKITNNWAFKSVNTDMLGGTPLEEAKMDMIPIVDDFLKKHQIQKLSTIFMTDGYGHSKKSGNMYQYKNKMFNRGTLNVEEFFFNVYRKMFPNAVLSNIFLGSPDYVGYNRYITNIHKVSEEFYSKGNILIQNYPLYDNLYCINPSTKVEPFRGNINTNKQVTQQLGELSDSFKESMESKKRYGAISRTMIQLFEK